MPPIIRAENIGKRYIISHEKPERYQRFSELLLNPFRRRKDSGTQEEFWALKDIDFEIEQGDRVGIIGRNGAGKSTLLKVLSKITVPTTGKISVNGRIASLLEVGTGFHPELSGRENIYLNGAILGMKRAEVKKKFDEIVDFAGVEKFLDTPVKRYSSGMYVRLAFAVAAHLEPEILVIDEVLAVGDAEFQKKCLGKMDDISKQQGRTILFVSHNMGAVAQLCNRGIVLNEGRIIENSSIEDAIRQYESTKISKNGIYQDSVLSNKEFQITEAKLLDLDGNSITEIATDNQLRLCIDFFSAKKPGSEELSIAVFNGKGGRVFTVTQPLKKIAQKANSIEQILFEFEEYTLTPGEYFCTLAIHIPGVYMHDFCEKALRFSIADSGTIYSRYPEGSYGMVFVNYICNNRRLSKRDCLFYGNEE